jgi:hypothetical protein
MASDGVFLFAAMVISLWLTCQLCASDDLSFVGEVRGSAWDVGLFSGPVARDIIIGLAGELRAEVSPRKRAVSPCALESLRGLSHKISVLEHFNHGGPVGAGGCLKQLVQVLKTGCPMGIATKATGQS